MVVFVIGPACAGKSTFIKEKFPTYKMVDVYDYQKKYRYHNFETVMESYIECNNVLEKVLMEHENVVLEHTLLRRCRRDMYIDTVKKVRNEPIILYIMYPEVSEFIKRKKLRGINCTENMLNEELKFLEYPEKDDGFSEVYIVHGDGHIDKYL